MGTSAIQSVLSTACPRVSTLLAAAAISLICGPILLFVEFQWLAPKEAFLRDPLAAASEFGGYKVYYGAVSLLGSMFWSAAAAISLLTYAIVRVFAPSGSNAHYLLLGGLLSLALCFDDTFMLHELVFPRLGIDERLVMATIVVLTCIYLWSLRALLNRRIMLLLAFSLCCLGLSMGVDLFFVVPHMAEDGFKFIGIVSWMVFHFCLAIDEIYFTVGVRDNSRVDGSGLV
ncbi:MAG: hypothetical protein AAFV69_09860 [Pseudomonadota bacterium]